MSAYLAFSPLPPSPLETPSLCPPMWNAQRGRGTGGTAFADPQMPLERVSRDRPSQKILRGWLFCPLMSSGASVADRKPAHYPLGVRAEGILSRICPVDTYRRHLSGVETQDIGGHSANKKWPLLSSSPMTPGRDELTLYS